MRKLYQFDCDCGRSGSLEGLFFREESDVKELIKSEREVYFGEVLGKHSEVCGAIEKKDLTAIEGIPEDVLKILEEKLGTTVSGYNPFDYEFLDDL